MPRKLWQHDETPLLRAVETYTVGEDHQLDLELLPHDIEASLAHAQMLAAKGVLTDEELKQLQEALTEIGALAAEGRFTILAEQEDMHTAIEQYLHARCPQAGKKIHTLRSRNDQILVALRLYMRQKHESLRGLCAQIIEAATNRIAGIGKTPMPGYTHWQKAMPTSVGAWLGAYRDAFHDQQRCMEGFAPLLDQNPLGSLAGFGTSGLKPDRALTTRLLGFTRIQENPLYCGLSRGFFEYRFLQELSPLMLLSAKFARDMLLFTTQEFGFFSLPASFTTGSSIMPQKRNYDLFEIMRAHSWRFHACSDEIRAIFCSIPGGYQRDLQLTKGPFLRAVRLCEDVLHMLGLSIANLQINEEKLAAAMTPDLMLTDSVYAKVAEGVSFREAYIEAKEHFFAQSKAGKQNPDPKAKTSL